MTVLPGQSQLPASVVSAASAGNGMVPIANGSNGYVWGLPSAGASPNIDGGNATSTFAANIDGGSAS